MFIFNLKKYRVIAPGIRQITAELLIGTNLNICITKNTINFKEIV